MINNPLRYTDPSGQCHYDANGNIDKWDCTVEEFDQMSIAERQFWLEQFMRQTGTNPWFNNILGVLDFMGAERQGAPGSWFSLVDAAILQGISHGYGLFSGKMHASQNWGAAKWSLFFSAHRAQQRQQPLQPQISNDQLRQLWGEAEQAATDYGVWYAANGINPRTGQPYGVHPTMQENVLIQITDVYRSAVQVPSADLLPLFDPLHPQQRQLVAALAISYWRLSQGLRFWP